MKKYILSLDQGTTSSRAVLINHDGCVCFFSQYEFRQFFPKPGWVEHDPMEILDTQLKAARDCIDFIINRGESISDIAAIGIANQRETTILWDKNNGKPIYNAIVWQCKRTIDYCNTLKEQGMSSFFSVRTGLIPDPYFSATKIKWILDNVPETHQKAEVGDILFGTIDSWLIWNLTGGRVHATDHTNASRTMLFNINKLKWDKEILSYLDIPMSVLPEVKNSSDYYGETTDSLFGECIPIYGCVGDQQAALVGQRCFTKGEVKNTYGTGGFLLINTGNDCIVSKHGLLTTIAYSINEKVNYALEGSVFISGAVIKWLRDELGIINSAEETETIARSITDSDGVFFVPAFSGLGTPYWDCNAHGMIYGMTRGTKKAHIVRAALEGIAFQTADVIQAMTEDVGTLKMIKVDGGASKNDFLMQFQSDILGIGLFRPDSIEATAMGCAFLAGIGCGFWNNLDEINDISQKHVDFFPSIDKAKRQALINGWRNALKRTLSNYQ